jgi:aminodeoxyfutalosine deaminase
MAYEKLQGDQLFDGNIFHGKEKVLVRDEKGKKLNIITVEEAGDDIKYVPGLISPGFVNAHCHLELSHMKNVIPAHTGLVPFLLEVVGKRDFPDESIHHSIKDALREMKNDGIVAVGDISNSDITAPYKSDDDIYFHTFVEVLSFLEEKTPARIEHFNSILDIFRKPGQQVANLTPHAPYSVSPLAFRMINDATEGAIISIHNQETLAEDQLYKTGNGDFLKLFQKFGMDNSPFPVTGQSSIRSYLPYFDRGQTIILVHNTFMLPEDIQWANELAKKKGLTLIYCFCINANLYIENQIPHIDDFIREDCQIVLGTDSYSSNQQLKISSEIQTIRSRFADIPISSIYRWATLNGAIALNTETRWLVGLPFVEGVQYGE